MIRPYIDDVKQILEKIFFAIRWLAKASAGFAAGTLTTAIWMAAVCLPIAVTANVSPTFGIVSLPFAAVICYLSILLDRRLTRIIEERRNSEKRSNASKETERYRKVWT